MSRGEYSQPTPEERRGSENGSQVEVVSQALLSELRSFSEDLIRGYLQTSSTTPETAPVTVDEELAAVHSRQAFRQQLREYARETLRKKVREWLWRNTSLRVGGAQYYISFEEQSSLEAHYLSDVALDGIVDDAILWVEADDAATKH